MIPDQVYRNKASRRWLRWLVVAVRCYVILVLVVVLLENFFIYPAPRYPGGYWNAASLGAEDVFFQAADGTKLHGWFFPHPSARGSLLFCHGNAEHVGYLGDEMAELRDDHRLNIFVFDYRGYGRSEGSPHEVGVMADAVAARDWLVARTGVTQADIYLMGRSIGGGVAVDLAAGNGARGLILWNTFSSMPDVGARVFPWIPVRWLMRNRYDSLSKIPKYQGPLLQTHGTADHIIELKLAEQLFAAAKTPDKTFVRVQDGGHNDSPSVEFLHELREFFNRSCDTL